MTRGSENLAPFVGGLVNVSYDSRLKAELNTGSQSV